MSTQNDLISEINSNKEHRLNLLSLNNKILESKLSYLTALKRHYKDHWLDFDLKCYDSKIDCLVSKAKFMVSQAISERRDEILRRLNDENVLLDEEIAEAKATLDQYKGLDPGLMAEYRLLKDDLECQEMLIEISEGNSTVTTAKAMAMDNNHKN